MQLSKKNFFIILSIFLLSKTLRSELKYFSSDSFLQVSANKAVTGKKNSISNTLYNQLNDISYKEIDQLEKFNKLHIPIRKEVLILDEEKLNWNPYTFIGQIKQGVILKKLSDDTIYKTPRKSYVKVLTPFPASSGVYLLNKNNDPTFKAFKKDIIDINNEVTLTQFPSSYIEYPKQKIDINKNYFNFLLYGNYNILSGETSQLISNQETRRASLIGINANILYRKMSRISPGIDIGLSKLSIASISTNFGLTNVLLGPSLIVNITESYSLFLKSSFSIFSKPTYHFLEGQFIANSFEAIVKKNFNAKGWFIAGGYKLLDVELITSQTTTSVHNLQKTRSHGISFNIGFELESVL